ncbi:Protein of unknown function [Gryllus bimaculatus]|nr:Protein of unknown function [Gryllus bimaculatus]
MLIDLAAPHVSAHRWAQPRWTRRARFEAGGATTHRCTGGALWLAAVTAAWALASAGAAPLAAGGW